MLTQPLTMTTTHIIPPLAGRAETAKMAGIPASKIDFSWTWEKGHKLARIQEKAQDRMRQKGREVKRKILSNK